MLAPKTRFVGCSPRGRESASHVPNVVSNQPLESVSPSQATKERRVSETERLATLRRQIDEEAKRNRR